MTALTAAQQTQQRNRGSDGRYREARHIDPGSILEVDPSGATPHRTPNGLLVWRLPDGRWHRDSGPAVIWDNGTVEYRQFGAIHRDDGPAVTSPDGFEAWYSEGKKHRQNGPAVTYADGRTEHWLYGYRVEPGELY